MAKDKKSFVLYCDQKGIWDKLDNEQAGKLIKHIVAYVNDENPSPTDFITELAFEPIKQQLKRDLIKWEYERGERSKSGHLGGIRSSEVRKQNKANEASASIAKQNEANTKQNEANEAVTVNVTVNDNVNVNVKGDIKTRAWFENQFDEIFLEQLQMNHKGKDLGRAISESWMHLSSDSLRLKATDQAGCKQLLNTWLSKMNGETKKPTRQPTFDINKLKI